MLNNEKIVLMTKLALYEQGEGKKTIPVSKYYKGDYVGMRLLSSFIYANIVFAIGFALWFCMSGTALLETLTNKGINYIAKPIVISYIVVVVAYLLVAYVYYTYKFKSTRRSLKGFNNRLHQLNKLQEREIEALTESENDMEMGGDNK
ncbi:MAG: hypothetical protein IKN54_05520 [Lachnospiraceae bacterium]|nr:hypothetical protein [Lachnospiraceae bacterium]